MASDSIGSPSTEKPHLTLGEYLRRKEVLQTQRQQMDSVSSDQRAMTHMAPPGPGTPLLGADRTLGNLNPPSMAQQPQPNTPHSRDFVKCDQCRREHKKCLPQVRDWNGRKQKCNRCHRLGHPCGPQIRKKSSIPADNDGAIESSRLLRRPVSSHLLPAQSSGRIAEHDFPQSTTLEQPQARPALHRDGPQVTWLPPIASSPYSVPLRRSSNPDFLNWGELDQTFGKLVMESAPQASHSGYNTSDPLMQEFLEWKHEQELQKQRQQLDTQFSDRAQMTHMSPPRPGTPIPGADQTELYTFDHTPNTTYQSTPFFSKTTPFPGQHASRVSTLPSPTHTLWQPQNPDSYTVIHHQSNLHDFAVVPHDDEDMTMILDDEGDVVHFKSPILAPQPEELELYEDQDYSAIESVTDNDRAIISSGYPTSSSVLERSGVKPFEQAQRKSTERYTCDKCPQSFTTLNDLNRHRRGVHLVLDPGQIIWRCKFSGCTQIDKICPRKHNFLQHLKRMHFNGLESKDADAKAHEVVDKYEEKYDFQVHGLPAGSAILGTVPPSDSGYASHKPIQNGHLDDQEQREVVTEAPALIKPAYASTSYTGNASLETTRRVTFVEKLAEQIVTDLGITSANASSALKLCDEIVDILAKFALKLGCGTSVNELERAMVFIHKYRKNIGSYFRSIILCRDHEDDYDDDETRSRSDDMPLSDKMQMYRDSMIADPVAELSTDAVDGDHAGDLDCATELDQDSVPSDDIEDFNKYLSYVCKTPHYEWLLATSRCKITLTSNNEIMSDVRQSILSTLPQATNVRRLACHCLLAVFNVKWAPQQVLEQRWRSFDQTSFPRNHLRDMNKGEADGSFTISSFKLGDILTITGESSETQALTCSAYLTQTWPMTGRFILQLLEEVIIYGRKSERSVQRTDGTQITVSQEDEQSLKVLVSGTKDTIAEVGEQLAWLGAALRCSPSEEGAVYCTARISSTETPVLELNADGKNLNAATSPRETRPRLNDQHFKYPLESPRDARALFSFIIDFELEDVPVPLSSSGTCWKHLFQSPVIARGFPVMRRAQPSLGLEMPMNVMAGLLGTSYVHTFGGGIFLKGHSALLYPTQTVEDVVVWHLQFDSRKHYMPYPSKDKAKLVEVSTDRLAELRHVVGWCQVAENRTGIIDGNNKTERCNRLSWAKAGCVLEGCALSFGKSIVGGTPFTLLNGHDSRHIIRKSYSTMLNYLSTRFVVFFDARDRRGWLVNGVNALHHILRTSLEEDKACCMQNQNSLFVLKPNQLVEPEEAGAASAAWQFLDNRSNIFCKITLSNILNNDFDGGGFGSYKEVYETLGHRLEQFHDALETLFNYQIQAEELRGRQNRSRAIYEGWDFVDVTRRRDQRPRVMKLPLEGMACVDLLRSARAITLFGNGFGDLILPSSETFCRGWQTLPKMKYYIASSTADIQKLIKEEGESSRDSGEPPQLSCVGRIMWFSPPASLDDCRCDTGNICLAKVVQIPWPRKHRSLVKGMKGPGTLESEGAIVFGYNSLVQWHWPEIGDPRPGPPPVLVAEDSDDDSGLGSSIDSVATDQSTVTTTVPKYLLDYRRGYPLFPDPEQSPKTYGNATVSGGRHNHFGDSFHQIINNYQQQTTDIAVLGSAGSKHERDCGMMEPPSDRTTKRRRLA